MNSLLFSSGILFERQEQLLGLRRLVYKESFAFGKFAEREKADLVVRDLTIEMYFYHMNIGDPRIGKELSCAIAKIIQ